MENCTHDCNILFGQKTVTHGDDQSEGFHYLDSGSNDVLFKGCHHVRLSVHIYLVLLKRNGDKFSTFYSTFLCEVLALKICFDHLSLPSSPLLLPFPLPLPFQTSLLCRAWYRCHGARRRRSHRLRRRWCRAWLPWSLWRCWGCVQYRGRPAK